MSLPDEKWLRACLRIHGDELDLDRVTQSLGLKPDFSGRKGEHIGDNPRRAVFESNLWGLRSNDEFSASFEQQLQAFVARLEERGEALSALARRPGVDAELLLGYSSSGGQGGLTLSAELLARIASLGLDIYLDLYPPVAET